MMSRTITDSDLCAILREKNLNPRRSGGGWTSRCPAHDDRSPSLSIKITADGRLLAYCHAGCTFKAIIDAMGCKAACVMPVGHRPEPQAFSRWQWETLRTHADPESVVQAERRLGIPVGGLVKVGAVWSLALGALAAPMFEKPAGPVVGVRLRADDGRKWAVPGSKNAMFMPTNFSGVGPLFIPEGFTDTAALVGLGFDAIGRPSATAGDSLVRLIVAGPSLNRPIIVVADADATGRESAIRLTDLLRKDGAPAKMLCPPPRVKDVREWIAKGADAKTIAFAARHC